MNTTGTLFAEATATGGREGSGPGGLNTFQDVQLRDSSVACSHAPPPAACRRLRRQGGASLRWPGAVGHHPLHAGVPRFGPASRCRAAV